MGKIKKKTAKHIPKETVSNVENNTVVLQPGETMFTDTGHRDPAKPVYHHHHLHPLPIDKKKNLTCLGELLQSDECKQHHGRMCLRALHVDSQDRRTLEGRIEHALNPSFLLL